ncbi:MAG: hypothetical protein BMS9Abin34_358 [Patescibacteria group bacterium]|nr:MAG: hypothetical protein BMS9Abin34_358 [Patescibacteria group bacterium]
MPEKQTTPQSQGRPPAAAAQKGKGLSTYARMEERFSELSRKQLVLLILGVSVFFIALGVLVGVVFSPYRPTVTSGTELPSSNSGSQVVSHSGVVRKAKNPDNGAGFYLEKSDDSKLQLKSSKIDLSFFEGSSVTAEGVVVGSGDEGLFFVRKIRIK